MSKETQEYIIEKAKDLFYRYGIRSITMDFIASELGMSKRTLYENFKNKDELVAACLERGRIAQETEMCAILNSDANTIEKLVRCYNRIIYFVNQTSYSFQFDVDQMRTRMNGEVEKYREKQFQYIRDILYVGVREGLIRSNLNIDIVTAIHNNQMEWFSKSENSKNWNTGEFIGTMVTIFLYGIVTEEGRKVLDEINGLITQTL